MIRSILATTGAMLILSTPIFADDPYNQGYSFGYQAGRDFCNGQRSVPRHSPQVDQFLAGCKDGFLKAIDDNSMCRASLSPTHLWDDMMNYRSKTCS
jgi:hypothetical protein